MAATQQIYLKGKGKWCQRLFIPDEKFDPPAWKFDFYPDTDSYNIIMKLKNPEEANYQGLLNKIKKDDDGYYLQIKRPVHINGRKGQVKLAPPVILDAEGNPWNGDAIGNGSDLTIKLAKRIYPTPTKKMGIAIRLESVRVDNLVPFEKEQDFPPDMAKSVEGLSDQAKPNW